MNLLFKKLILKDECKIYKKRNNFYYEIDNITITINLSSYILIITHIIKSWLFVVNILLIWDLVLLNFTFCLVVF